MIGDDDWRSTESDELFAAILSLTDVAEAERFFRDLCTRRELEEMISRWRVVRLLAAGMSYREIHDRTGVATATITRINQWLRHGTGGYRDMLVRLGSRDEEVPA